MYVRLSHITVHVTQDSRFSLDGLNLFITSTSMAPANNQKNDQKAPVCVQSRPKPTANSGNRRANLDCRANTASEPASERSAINHRFELCVDQFRMGPVRVYAR